MSTPDYETFTEDHQCLLVVIKQIGPQMSPKLFDLIYDRISQLGEFKVTDNQSKGFERIIRLRYRRSYSIENNDWADFQVHRRLVGLITVARSLNDNEIESICELHNTIRDTYTNTLFDSRCFIIRSSGGKLENNEDQNDKEETNNDIKMIDTDAEKMVEQNSCSSENGLFDFNVERQLYDNALKTRVNQSSSSSSSSSSLDEESAKSDASEQQQQQQQPISMPDPVSSSSLSSGFCGSEHPTEESAKFQLEQPRIQRPRTHSRNKSFDSRILNQKSITDDDGHVSITNPKFTNRTHSSSSLVSGGDNESIPEPTSSTNEYVRYETDEQCCQQIETRVRQFISGLFWVLEKKRFERSKEKLDKVPLLMAPFEKKDLIGLDTDSRSFRKKCLGRMRKHIADLSLLAGLPVEALQNYLSAIEQLKVANDKLWLASALEGYCASSLALLYPSRWQHVQKLRRQFRYDQGMLATIIARSDYEQARTEVANYQDRHCAANMPIDATLLNNRNLFKNIIPIDQFYDKYKEAASNYAQYRGAAIIEVECSFKAVKSLAFFGQKLRASEFIQNAVFVAFSQTHDEQIERLIRVSHLYEMIRFYRKAAFYKRFAALKTVSAQLKSPDWHKCYYLLLPALHGYEMSLNPVEHEHQVATNRSRWSGIHVQILQEMITTASKMENEMLGMRHLSFMLQCLFNHISIEQRKDYASKLSTLAAKSGEGSPVVLHLANNFTIPSVNFTKFPTVISFKVEPLATFLRPYKLKWKEELEARPVDVNDVFIYSALRSNRPATGNLVRSDGSIKLGLFWVEGEIGRVKLRLHNYLPIELGISSIMLMTDGVAFEPKHDTSLRIAPESTAENVSLTGVPRATGCIDILGYRLHSLGVKSDCLLGQLPTTRKLKLPTRYSIEVIPRLPLMCAACLDEEQLVGVNNHKDLFGDIHISSSSQVSIYNGQTKQFQIKLSNISRMVDELIEIVSVKVLPSNIDKTQAVHVTFDPEEINQACPSPPGQPIVFTITLEAKTDFFYERTSRISKAATNAKQDVNLLTGKKKQVFGSSKLANLISEFQNTRKTSELLSSKQLDMDKDTTIAAADDGVESFSKELLESKRIDLAIQFEYSGGPGLLSGFCRRTAIHLAVEVKPSILITHWDVISAEQPHECYLVLDALNATVEEASFRYSANKEMLIEPQEKCRIPVPIQRCPINTATAAANTELLEANQGFCRRPSKNLEAIINANDFLSFIFPQGLRLDAVFEECRRHLLAQVELRWHLVEDANLDDGQTQIKDIPFSIEMLKALLIPPVQSELTIDDCPVGCSADLFELNVPLGVHTKLFAKLRNTTDSNLRPLRLIMVIFQDYQNPALPKSRKYQTDQTVLIIGQQSTCIEKLRPQEVLEINYGLVFQYPGVFRLELCLVPEEKYQEVYSSDPNGMTVERIYDRFAPTEALDSGLQSLCQSLHSAEFTVCA